jgi:Ca2+-binding RTX toxin-like protein
MPTFNAYLATVMGKLPKTSKANPIVGTETTASWFQKTTKACEITGLEGNMAVATGNFSNTTKINAEVVSALKGDDTIIGSAFADTLHGYAGNDVIYGSGGKDVLYGDAGADVFVFDEALGNNNVDTIKDFNIAEGDSVHLDSAVFTGLTAGPLDATAFVLTTSNKPVLETSNPCLVFNTKTGTLYFDADGSGTDASLVKVAIIGGKPTLSAANFEVVTTLDLDLY